MCQPMRIPPIAAAPLLVTMIACSNVPTAPDGLTGTWGGQHVSIAVTTDRAEFQFDCAHGAIDSTLTLTRDGSFKMQGYLVVERGGPIDTAIAEARLPATYAGERHGDTITFAVTIPGNTIGPLTATKGAPPSLFRCLSP